MSVIDNKAVVPPAEWEEHAAVWTAWPTGDDLWAPEAKFARLEVEGLIRSLSEDCNDRKGDKVKLLVKNEEARESAQAAVGDLAEIILQPYGDIWLRDTGPIFLTHDLAASFRVNGWGGKYIYEHDDKVSRAVAWIADARSEQYEFVLEGGAIDGDGKGTFLTTRECLLNANRNPDWKTQADAEEALQSALGARKVIWLEGGLLNDHTDGHVDNVARFVGPAHVVCMAPTGDDDPNADVLNAIYDVLSHETDADGNKLKVTRIPSPGLYRDAEGAISPASHMNFLIGNASVIMPIYGEKSEAAAEEAISILQDIFKDRQLIGLPSNYILTGGGSFHCITQQQPA
ncbi:agmatine deiminase family protein [Hirschia baltica]|uniref:Agmatine deiminase n=1 Tax=Hirschia baltica (strain ATCC 49814 / DSM 5838 / IFAM 1418) TaxID=582402 RepID=C6XL06_HIRBI|nr:agmatine deiminase family protein [Hirschia baltica]ACT57835.1 Agmatine deiminase [Hirschia baltica ATCC 49814]